jgi:hypothetical protein
LPVPSSSATPRNSPHHASRRARTQNQQGTCLSPLPRQRRKIHPPNHTRSNRSLNVQSTIRTPAAPTRLGNRPFHRWSSRRATKPKTAPFFISPIHRPQYAERFTLGLWLFQCEEPEPEPANFCAWRAASSLRACSTTALICASVMSGEICT